MIGNISSKARYAILSTTPVGSGYAIPFKYWEGAQLQAKLVSTTGIETTIDSTNYSVTTPSDSGTLTFAGGYVFPDNAAVLTIYRTLDFEQQTDFRNGDILDAEVLERVVDATIAQIQQLDERVKRALVIPLSDPDATLEIPSSQVRGNMLLGFDSTGELITILTTDIEQKLTQALNAEESVLSMFNDPGMVIVRNDMALGAASKIVKVSDNKANIDIVALAITNVNAVGANISNVNGVAGNAANINAVNSNKTNIDAVVANSSNINTVAARNADIIKLSGIDLKISAVADNEANVTAVGTDLLLGAASKVKIVAEDKTNIDAVAANKTNIDAVAGNKTNIDAAVANASNINAVVANAANINAVNGNKTNIDVVAGNSAYVVTVAGSIASVTTVAANIAALNSIASNLVAILAASTHAANALTYKNAAEAARDKAQQWAEEAEDTPVETDKYSALHHATKAAASAALAQSADASANKQITIDGVLYQYGLTAVSGHLSFNLTEVV